jgi:anthranilate 1,2-dioxygenase ferredoxin reductase component
MVPARRFVIIGAGPAGMRAAELLRTQSPEAEILLVGEERYPPYQRPPLSKGFITDRLDIAELYLKPPAFYEAQRIQLKLGCRATAIDRARKIVALADGGEAPYDRLLIATGCRARHLPARLSAVPVLYLRNLDDSAAIRDRLAPDAVVAIIGGGFIGLELAAAARKLGAAVTVLEAAPALLGRSMPPLVADFVRRMHEEKGVRFELGAAVEAIEAGEGGRAIVHTRRAGYGCDAVIAGIGALPDTALAEAAGLAVEDGILVDAHGRSSDPDIFAAGDVTRHENPLLGRAIRVESWQVALNQAASVARAMLGGEAPPYAELPWLWTDQYDCNIQMLGLFDPAAEAVIRGDPRSSAFTMIGLDAEARIAAAITVNTGRDMSVLRRLAASRASLPREALADPDRKLADLLKALPR